MDVDELVYNINDININNNDITKKFRFIDEYDSNNNEFCEITIRVFEKYYNNTTYYDITYDFSYSNPNDQAQKCNPFIQMDNNIQHSDGEIIVKNSFTQELIKYLLMDFDELEKYSGLSTPNYYKIKIIQAISLFWD